MDRTSPTRRSLLIPALGAACALALAGCSVRAPATPRVLDRSAANARPSLEDRSTPKARRLAEAAMSQVGTTVRYDAAYVPLKYPGGDVPLDRGVCTDVLVRAFRVTGIDLQVEVHEDMADAFDRYPSKWGLKQPDTNIDHRRVPNLQTFFERRGKAVPVTDRAGDYRPGDIVTWDVWGRPHIGLVSTQLAPSGDRFCIVHNIGQGTKVEDRLFGFRITGHYRYF